MPRTKVKWGDKELSLNVDLGETPLLFKAQLYEQTNIPPDRQKLIVKGRKIPNDSWNGFSIQDGTVIMLVGSADSVQIKTQDGSEDQYKSAVQTRKDLPVGLQNLGNTCYMNSSLQCFKVIPELEDALRKFNSDAIIGTENTPNQRTKLVTNSLKALYTEMDRVAKEKENDSPSVIPLIFVHVLRQIFPQFNSLDERGNHQQQDANECFCELLRMLTEDMSYAPECSEGGASSNHKVPLKRFFEIEHQIVVKCKEEGSTEKPQQSQENVVQLSCFLDQEVRFIQAGIKSKMLEEIEKYSESLGRNAKYEKRSLISRLPAYLSIQMVRFFYKEEKKISAKVLKDVKFPIVLDVFDLCTPELQEKLKPARNALKEFDETKIELLRQAKLAEGGQAKIDLKPKEYLNNYFADDIGSNNSGMYELKCLITHQGRSINSGHYVAWVRVCDDDDDDSGQAKWAVCDDNNVEPVSEEEILKLSGGGDWHCAYVFVYGPKKIPKLDKLSGK